MLTQNCPLNVTNKDSDITSIIVNDIQICYDSPLEKVSVSSDNSNNINFVRYNNNGDKICNITIDPTKADINTECTNFQNNKKKLQFVSRLLPSPEKNDSSIICPTEWVNIHSLSSDQILKCNTNDENILVHKSNLINASFTDSNNYDMVKTVKSTDLGVCPKTEWGNNTNDIIITSILDNSFNPQNPTMYIDNTTNANCYCPYGQTKQLIPYNICTEYVKKDVDDVCKKFTTLYYQLKCDNIKNPIY